MAKDDHQKPSTLFREEAVRAAYESFGNPFQTRQLSIAMAAFLFVALLIGTAIFLASASYARTVTVQGVLMPARGTIDIVSDRAGVIVNIPARNGDLLSTNDPILVVSATPTLEHGRTLAAAISAVSARQMSLMQRSLDGKLELLTLNISALRTQRSELERDIRALAIQIDLQTKRVQLARSTLAAMRKLENQQLISLLELRSGEEKYYSAKQKLVSITREISNQRAALTKVTIEVNMLATQKEIAIAESELSTGSTKKEKLTASASNRTIYAAPASGILSGLRVQVGDAVAPGLTLATILPRNGEIVAELWVPSSALGFLKKGTRVQLMLDSFPYQKFGLMEGQISYIAASPTEFTELPTQFQSRRKQNLYRVLADLKQQHVTAYGTNRKLSPGMLFNADLVLNERSALSWLIDPLLGTEKRLSN